MNSRHIAVVASTYLLISIALPVGAATEQPDGPFGGEISGSAQVERGVIGVDVAATTPGSVESAGGAGPAPEGFWVSWSTLDLSQDPPCVSTTGELLDAASREIADQVAADRENTFIITYENYLDANVTAPQPCAGTPGIDAAAARQYADEAISLLPRSAPTISGGYAITGLRSWLDLQRDATFTNSRELDLGPFTRTATLTATSTTAIDWGDGTTTEHTSTGGPYHDGEPGPEDITHTYVDTSDSITLTVTDTWEITVVVPGLEPITLTHTADPVSLTFPVREVRSTRDV